MQKTSFHKQQRFAVQNGTRLVDIDRSAEKVVNMQASAITFDKFGTAEVREVAFACVCCRFALKTARICCIGWVIVHNSCVLVLMRLQPYNPKEAVSNTTFSGKNPPSWIANDRQVLSFSGYYEESTCTSPSWSSSLQSNAMSVRSQSPLVD